MFCLLLGGRKQINEDCICGILEGGSAGRFGMKGNLNPPPYKLALMQPVPPSLTDGLSQVVLREDYDLGINICPK